MNSADGHESLVPPGYPNANYNNETIVHIQESLFREHNLSFSGSSRSCDSKSLQGRSTIISDPTVVGDNNVRRDQPLADLDATTLRSSRDSLSCERDSSVESVEECSTNLSVNASSGNCGNSLDGELDSLAHDLSTSFSTEDDHNDPTFVDYDPSPLNAASLRLIVVGSNVFDRPRSPTLPGVQFVPGPVFRVERERPVTVPVVPVVGNAVVVDDADAANDDILIVDGKLEKCVHLDDRRTQTLMLGLVALFVGLVVAIIVFARSKTVPITASTVYFPDSSFPSVFSSSISSLSPSLVPSDSPTFRFSESPSSSPTVKVWDLMYSTLNDDHKKFTSLHLLGKMSGDGMFVMIGEKRPSSSIRYHVLRWDKGKGWVTHHTSPDYDTSLMVFSISYDASLIVMGLPFFDSGDVIHRSPSYTNNTFRAFGLTGKNTTYGLLGEVSLSSDGTRLAISQLNAFDSKGCVFVYDLDENNIWVESVLDGRELTHVNDSMFGSKLEMSKDGKTMAVVSWSGVGGVAHLYTFSYYDSESSWQGLHPVMEMNGHYLSLADDGRVLAIDDADEDDLTKIYEYDESLSEYKMIVSSSEGYISSLSGDGNRIALSKVSSYFKVGAICKVYEISGNELVPIGRSIAPCLPPKVCSIVSLSLSYDGHRIAVTAFLENLDSNDRPVREDFVHVYEYYN